METGIRLSYRAPDFEATRRLSRTQEPDIARGNSSNHRTARSSSFPDISFEVVREFSRTLKQFFIGESFRDLRRQPELDQISKLAVEPSHRVIDRLLIADGRRGTVRRCR